MIGRSGGAGGLCRREMIGRTGGAGGLCHRIRTGGAGGQVFHRVLLQAQAHGVAGRAMATLPPFRSRGHFCEMAVSTKVAATSPGRHLCKTPFSCCSHVTDKFAANSPGHHLCKTKTKLNCCASNSDSVPSSSDIPSASPTSLDLLHSNSSDIPSASPTSLDLLHSKMDRVLQKVDLLLGRGSVLMGIKQVIWNVLAVVISVVCLVLLFVIADGRAYMEKELKTVFLNFTSDPEVQERLGQLIEEGVDTTVYHVMSVMTWLKWFQRLRGR